MQVFAVEHLVPIALGQFAQNRISQINLSQNMRKMDIEIVKACDLKVKIYNAVSLIDQVAAVFKDNSYVVMAISDATEKCKATCSNSGLVYLLSRMKDRKEKKDDDVSREEELP